MFLSMCFSYSDNSERGIELILISTKSSMPSIYDVHVLVCMFCNWFQKITWEVDMTIGKILFVRKHFKKIIYFEVDSVISTLIISF